MKNIKKYIFTLLISISSFLLGVNYVNAEGLPGEILVSKTAVKEDVTYGRSATVTLGINANAFTEVDKTDIVLVIDRSTSMNGTKIVDTKTSAINLIDTLLNNDTLSKVRVGIVAYGRSINNAYTSASLTNDSTVLKNLVNSIPNKQDENGTNIHSGLIGAKNLLSTSEVGTNKVVILLSDGEPYQYIGTDNKTVCEDRNKFCKSTPSDSAKMLSNEMKKNNTLVYTIAFNVDSNSNAYNLLGSIASNANCRYSATDYTGLITTFNNIVKSFSTVATNAKVEDIIPVGFRLSSTLSNDAVFEENNDGTTTITWNVGDISSLQKESLSYNVEAREMEYGSMYTNVSAVLTATSTDENPKYGSNKPITIDFEKPNIPIPSLTIDDDYSNNKIYFVKQGEALTIDKEEGLLQNDKLTHKHLDLNTIVTDEIVLLIDDTTTGNISDIAINNKDGSFTYLAGITPFSEETKAITYKYYIKTIINIDGDEVEVRSNTSTITIKVIKNPIKYIVNYLEKETNKVLHNQKIGDGYSYYEVKEIAQEINGYTLDGNINQTLTLTDSIKNNIINFYYESDNGVVKSIYIDSENNELFKPITLTGKIGSTYKTNAKEIDKYKLIKTIGEESGKYSEDGVLVTYIYEKVPDTGLFKTNDSLYISIISISLFSTLLFIKKKMLN